MNDHKEQQRVRNKDTNCRSFIPNVYPKIHTSVVKDFDEESAELFLLLLDALLINLMLFDLRVVVNIGDAVTQQPSIRD